MNFQQLLRPVPRSAVLRMDGWQVWCGTMIQGQDERYYLLFSRWPQESGHQGWVSCSEIGVAVSDQPLGPYTFSGIALGGSGDDAWDAASIHNPVVIEYEGKYYLYYMGTRRSGEYWEYRNSQRIGVAIADHPAGPWRRTGKPVIDVSSGSWDHLMVSNPTVTVGYDGKVYMMYKGVSEGTLPKGGKVICGMAVADHPLGPFVKQPEPVMVNPEHDWSVEDPFIWTQNGKYYALAKDFQGYFAKHRGKTVALFESADALHWQPSAKPFAFDREIHWEDGEIQQVAALERPQLWLKNGKPAVLFCAVAADSGREETFNVHIPLAALSE